MIDPLSRRQRWNSALTVAAIVGALYFGRDLFLPLVLAGLLCFLLAPLCKRFEKWRFGRIGSVLATTMLAFSLIAGVAYVCASQVLDLADSLPGYRTNLLQKVATLKIHSNGPLRRASETIEDVTNALNEEPETPAVQVKPGSRKETPPVRVEVVSTAGDAWESLQAVLRPMLAPLSQAAVVVVLVVFMLLGREDLRDRLIHLIGHGRLPMTTQALDDAGQRISRYLLAQVMVNVSYGVPLAIGLWFIGIPNAVLWGLLGTVLRFLPYIGPWIAASFPLAVSLAVSNSWTTPLLVLALVVCLELISNNAVEPWLYGASTGLSAIAIVASAVFWTWLWGSVGLVLATPLTVCLAVAGKHVPSLAFLDLLLGQKPPIAPSNRLYQRMLALDEEEAVAIVEKHAEEESVDAAMDEVMLPALVNADADDRKGLVSEETRAERLQLLRDLLDELNNAPTVSDEANPQILLIPAAREVDEIAALMLAHLLRARGLEVRVLSAKLLVAESLAKAVELAPPLLCICSLPPVSVLAARQLCKRLRAQLSDTRIVVALLQSEDDEFARRRERLEKAGAEDVLSNLTRTAARIAELATLKVPAG
jgi:predicted PurR-regulated permease PerM/CheY-like chemotaxis protein